jgi:hypothetical protein
MVNAYQLWQIERPKSARELRLIDAATGERAAAVADARQRCVARLAGHLHLHLHLLRRSRGRRANRGVVAGVLD